MDTFQSMPITGPDPGCMNAPYAAPTGADVDVLLVTAVALVDIDGRVLLGQRSPDKHMGGMWEFPGGKVHAGETPETALQRELKEELGIDITQSCLAPFTFASHYYPNNLSAENNGFHLLMPLFICRVWKGTVQGLEGQSLKWVRPNDMGGLEMPPADRPLVAMLQDFL